MKHRGFTMVEVLVVVAILAILAGIAYPLGRSLVASSREAACLNNLRSLGAALQSYLQEHQNRLPVLEAGRSSKEMDVPVLDELLLTYLDGVEAFHCPEDQELFRKSGSSYLWNSTQNGRLLSDIRFFGITGRPDKVPLITDKEAWHPHGSNFLYADQTSSNKPRFATNR